MRRSRRASNPTASGSTSTAIPGMGTSPWSRSHPVVSGTADDEIMARRDPAPAGSPRSGVDLEETHRMGFGQQPGPPPPARQVQELLELLHDAGHVDFRDARGP